MKKILLISGHPHNESLCSFLAQEYAKGARESGFDVRLVQLADLKFDPVLHLNIIKTIPGGIVCSKVAREG